MRGLKGLRYHRERSEIWAWPFYSPVVQRFPRRGGYYSNGGYFGLGYESCNSPRSYAAGAYGARPRSRRQKKSCTAMHRQPTNRTGGVRSLPGIKMPGQ